MRSGTRGGRRRRSPRADARARAARPTAEAKAAAWESVVHRTDLPHAVQTAVAEAFAGLPQDGAEVLRPYVDRYFAVLAPLWDERSGALARGLVDALFPRAQVEETTLAATDTQDGPCRPLGERTASGAGHPCVIWPQGPRNGATAASMAARSTRTSVISQPSVGHIRQCGPGPSTRGGGGTTRCCVTPSGRVSGTSHPAVEPTRTNQ
ncbi:hypothetical protein [Streptomyces sioyaensis]|uniref:hypothetical protein n=1 Tax=Streptomyces sioyaensis TaxID=67364 RepID=UPI003D720F23